MSLAKNYPLHARGVHYDADFDGNAKEFAESVRDVVQAHPHLFGEDGLAELFFYGDCDQERHVVEYDGRSKGQLLPKSLWEVLVYLRGKYKPDFMAGYYPCDCSEYCDQDHGNGPLRVLVEKPSMHELVVARSNFSQLRKEVQAAMDAGTFDPDKPSCWSDS